MQILAIIASVGSLVCWIITLIAMFKSDKILPAILGIVCPLWAYIWGWMNKEKLGKSNLMLIWTACWVVGAITGKSLQG